MSGESASTPSAAATPGDDVIVCIDHITDGPTPAMNAFASSSPIESVAITPSSSLTSNASGPFTAPFDEATAFSRPTRAEVRTNFLSVTFRYVCNLIKIAFSLGLVVALAVGYGLGFRVLDIGITSVGLYGTILIVDFIVQFSCAMLNRVEVNRIASLQRKASKAIAAHMQALPVSGEKNTTWNHDLMNPNADVSIAVVGYREEEQAWRQCLRSLQNQTLPPKCVVGVVDGNDGPDQEMAQAFVEEFAHHKGKLVHLPLLLSDIHKDVYKAAMQGKSAVSRPRKIFNWLRHKRTADESAALDAARQAVIRQVEEWTATYELSGSEALCFTQPHGHKRTAMFTAFAVSMYGLRTRDAIFTTDSDTLLREDALDEMYTLLMSSPNIGGVTADVKIWNRADSFLARLCSIRYWFAFNIERACQSLWHCVACLSGPMAMYRAVDLHTILGPWNLQTFGGKETTFGDDRHLTNQILALGLNTRYTHRTWCESESPTTFVRWVVQQSRWSKSFFREAFWFPSAFTTQAWWLLVETTKQSLYPFILIATVCHFLFEPKDAWRPIIWLATMFGVAFVKSCIAVLISHDLWMILFTFYGFIYFFGLLPSKIYALLTMNKTTWGTSARSASERKRGQSFFQRSFHVCHLVVWYTASLFGLGYFTSVVFDRWYLIFIGFAAIVPCALLYWQPSPKKPPTEIKSPVDVGDSSTDEASVKHSASFDEKDVATVSPLGYMPSFPSRLSSLSRESAKSFTTTPELPVTVLHQTVQ